MTDVATRSPQLWFIDLVAQTDALLDLEMSAPRLSRDDEDRAARITDPAHRARRRATYVALRLILERAVGPHVRGVPLIRGPNGAPRLPVEGAGQFSIAHTPVAALIGWDCAGPIGVDLETPRTSRMDARRQSVVIVAASALSPVPLPADAPLLQAWVRLEALAKADGRGIGHLLAAIGAFGPKHGQDPGVAAANFATGCGVTVHDVVALDEGFAAVALKTGTSPPQVQSLLLAPQ
jgi:4'-phosphopantetheinyl transferase